MDPISIITPISDILSYKGWLLVERPRTLGGDKKIYVVKYTTSFHTTCGPRYNKKEINASRTNSPVGKHAEQAKQVTTVIVTIGRIAAKHASFNDSIVFASWRQYAHPSNTWYLGPTRVCLPSPNVISISSAVFAGLVGVSNPHTYMHTQTTLTGVHLQNNRPHLAIVLRYGLII